MYRCDQKFILDPLRDMVREKEVYGLVIVDKSDAIIGVLHGKKIKTLKELESIVPGKTRAGGQSAQRFERVREGLLIDFLKQVGDVATKQLSEYKDLKGIIVGGPGPIKESFVAEDYLRYDLKKKIIGTVNTAYTGEYGLHELVNKSEDLLEEAAMMKEKKILDRFFENFAKDTGLAVYGFKEVTEALRSGMVELLIISENFDWVKAKLKDEQGKIIEKMVKKHDILTGVYKEDGKEYMVVEEKELVEDIIEEAETLGTEAMIISGESPKGKQLEEIGGIAAILRFKA